MGLALAYLEAPFERSPRKYVGEAPFGNIKAARGFRQFLLRGIDQVTEEWRLICARHNLLKLFRAAGR